MTAKSERMKQIESLLADEPNDAFLRYGLAMEYASLGDDASAATKMLELLNDTPYVPGYLMAGQILNRIGRPSEAIEILRQGIKVAGDQRELHALGEMQNLLMTLE